MGGGGGRCPFYFYGRGDFSEFPLSRTPVVQSYWAWNLAKCRFSFLIGKLFGTIPFCRGAALMRGLSEPFRAKAPESPSFLLHAALASEQTSPTTTPGRSNSSKLYILIAKFRPPSSPSPPPHVLGCVLFTREGGNRALVMGF